ncbi:hypothetical protein SAMN05443635_12311 [Roseobacter denitrificans OCh 114]|nr:hypothetical protein SAMN05443635_12311 [Roseobacter denitrificans OCh 114]
MQTLHLRFRDLRAISLRQGLSRWRTPSDAMRAGMGGAFALPHPPEPTSAVGSRPAILRQRVARCPFMGAGLPLASPLREVSRPGADAPSRYRVCPRQTASDLSPCPAPHEAGDLGADHWQARASEVRRAPSTGLSFPLRPQRSGARAFGKKTADPVAHVRAWAGVSSGAHDYSHHGRGEGVWPATTSP